MLKQLLRSCLSQTTRIAIRRFGRRVKYYGRARYCPVCHAHLTDFRPHGNPPEPDAVCRICNSKSPHRLTGLLFREYGNYLIHQTGSCLHIAPEPELSKILRSLCEKSGMQYRCGGLDGGPEYFDLLDLPLSDKSVRLLYCCHVINMIADDRKAIREAFRVISKDGVAILQVPAYCNDSITKEAIGDDDSERLVAFRDPKIYRCYTDSDYRNRLREAGFTVESFESGFYQDDERKKMGLHDEVVHICFRDENHPLAKLLKAIRK